MQRFKDSMQLKSFPAAALQALSNFIFPSFCLNCKEKITDGKMLFCNSCGEFLEPLDPYLRCPGCFLEKDHPTYQCRKKEEQKLLTAIASTWEYLGPPKIFVEQFKFHSRPYLAKVGSAFLIAQFSRLGWPKPELIIPVPQSFPSRIIRGYDQSFLLAYHFSKSLGIPCQKALHKTPLALPQTSLSKEKRESMPEGAITLRSSLHPGHKTILLIDDVITTRSTIQSCAKAILKGHSAQIYALALCVTPI